MPLRRISSLLTVFHKFILPSIFIIGAFNLLIFGRQQRFSPDPNFPTWIPYAMVAFFLISSIWSAWRLKWVGLDDANQRLYISNYRKEISVPFSEIDTVSEFMLSDPRLITIRLKNPTELGEKIVFLGTFRFLGIFAGPHPIVDQLQTAAANSTGMK